MAYQNINPVRYSRSADRYPTNITADLVVDRRHSKILIADLSREGAMIRGDNLPKRGEEVVLRANALEVVATVVWRTEGFCGLTLHRAINPLEVVRNNKWPPMVVRNTPPRRHETRDMQSHMMPAVSRYAALGQRQA